MPEDIYKSQLMGIKLATIKDEYDCIWRLIYRVSKSDKELGKELKSYI